jgi:hypothetical protein
MQRLSPPRRSRNLSIQLLEDRRCLAVLLFEPHEISGRQTGVSSVVSADLDGDGDSDVVSASYRDTGIVWHENIDGKGTFSNQQRISPDASGTEVHSADLDRDGDMDIISVSRGSNRIAWHENLDGKGHFAAQRVITTKSRAPESLSTAGIDADGDLDLLSASADDDKIAWYENKDGKGSFGDQIVISEQADGARSVYPSDLDGDGDIDVVSASYGDDKIAWYENTDGKGSFGIQKVITSKNNGARVVSTADADGDGDIDVFSSSGSDDKLAWYENLGGGNFGQPFTAEHIVFSGQRDLASHYTADLDGDQDIDIVSVSLFSVNWYENVDSRGRFVFRKEISRQVDRAVAAVTRDIDRDGDVDVVTVSPGDSKIAWYSNADGMGTFGPQLVIAPFANDPSDVFASDLDGDGDNDVLSASHTDGKIAWYRNTDGRGAFVRSIISTKASGAQSVIAADLDSDGDNDVVSASYSDDKIAWYENLDGKGTFDSETVITTLADGAQSVNVADLDGDLDMDVIYASQNKGIEWQENTDGAARFGPKKVISDQARGARDVYAIDVDSDKDVDIVSVSRFDDTIAWYENTDGKGRFGAARIITNQADGAYSVHAADIDGDGDADVLSASRYDDTFAWYAKTDGNGTYSDAKIIARLDGAITVFASDIDRDGDMDAVLGGASQFGGFLSWAENIDGRGRFLPPVQLASVDVTSVTAADVDGDGDPDILSASPRNDLIAWHETLTPGDSNHDGIFNSSDLVAVFTAGEYEDAVKGNSTWEEGDWNRDGDFDTADLVYAFTNGTYSRAAVFEPPHTRAVDSLFATLMDDLRKKDPRQDLASWEAELELAK